VSDDVPPGTDDPNEGEEGQGKGGGPSKLPDYATVKARSKDISTLIARNRKIAGLERAVTSGWRKLTLKYKKMAEREMDKAIEQNHTVDGAVIQFKDQFEKTMTVDFGDESSELIIPRSIQAAGEGEVSIEQLVKRLTTDEIKQFSKDPTDLLSVASIEFIHERENLVKGMGVRLFNGMMTDIDDLVRTGGEVAEISGAVRGMVSRTFSASVNRAVTIGRTEVGTAFNNGRFNNMQEQGYAHHEWITNIDEFTRDTHADNDGVVRPVSEPFDNGLYYPQDPSGDAEEVINCRCLTIPITKEQYDERN
jgi:SPP1 gp7 family putative phage head morphogenesis protein